MSRTARIIGTLRLGYLHQVLTILVGLWLMPFLLSRLEASGLGMWLVITQVLGYLGLMDLGVVILLGRDLALAMGNADDEESRRSLIRQSVFLVWLQTPVVAVVAAAIWLGVASWRPELGGPLAIILGAFVVLFPLRLPGAILKGYQDLVFLGRLQIINWFLTTVLQVVLVLLGCGLYALVIGWTAGLFIGTALTIVRLRRFVPVSLLFFRRSETSFHGLRPRLVASLWMTIQQVAQAFLTGSEFILLGWLLGPAAVVVYMATSKLASVLQHQPNMLMLLSMPALGELRGSGNLERWTGATRSLSSIALMMCGFFCIGIAAVNETFVRVWIGDPQFGGSELTVAILIVMIVRTWNMTILMCLSSFGKDRLAAMTVLADGCISVTSAICLINLMGPVGLPLGYLAGAAIGSLPTLIVALAHEMRVKPWQLIQWNQLLGLGLLAVFIPVCLCVWWLRPLTIVQAGALAIGGTLLFVLFMWPICRREPLRSYWGQAIRSFGRRVAPAATASSAAGSP